MPSAAPTRRNRFDCRPTRLLRGLGGGLDFVAELAPDATEDLAVLSARLDGFDHARAAENRMQVDDLHDAPGPGAHQQDAIGKNDRLDDRMGDVADVPDQ